MRKNLLKFSAIFLSLSALSCSQVPKAPFVERCLIDLARDQMLCQLYKIDVTGGETKGPVFVRPIQERAVCFPLIRSWVPLADWRDELIMWAEDQEERRK